MKSKLLEYSKQYARETGVRAEVHSKDYIYQFLVENKVFNTKEDAVRYYFYDGQKSAETLEKLLFSQFGLKKDNTSILEFASGYGCVTRHLVKVVSPDQLFCSDIHPEANEFLSHTFGVRTIQSTIKPQDYPSDRTFDAVFALSFFSHMPPRIWGKWLEQLFLLVNPHGFLVFTTQGLASSKFHGNPLIPDTGIWFSPDSEQKDLDVHEYGQTIVTIDYVVNQVFSRFRVPFKLIRSEFWWEHQDLYVIQKPT